MFGPLPAEVIILLVLLTWWQDMPASGKPPLSVVEYFAGVARISALAKFMGYSSACVDIEFGKEMGSKRGSRPPMDINSNAGLLCLGFSKTESVQQMHFFGGSCRSRLFNFYDAGIADALDLYLFQWLMQFT